MNLCRQSIALVLTTKNKETKHHINPKHKRQTEKTALATKTNYHGTHRFDKRFFSGQDTEQALFSQHMDHVQYRGAT